jgi:hypothetical protein
MENIEVQKLQLNKLQNKLSLLLEEFVTNKKELEKVKLQNKELKETIKSQKIELEGFQYQEEISKIVGSVADGNGEKEELKTKIDTYIKEIDNCINFLNKAL